MAEPEYIKILRLIEYTGTREWVEETLKRSIQESYQCESGSIHTWVEYEKAITDPKEIRTWKDRFAGVDKKEECHG